MKTTAAVADWPIIRRRQHNFCLTDGMSPCSFPVSCLLHIFRTNRDLTVLDRVISSNRAGLHGGFHAVLVSLFRTIASMPTPRKKYLICVAYKQICFVETNFCKSSYTHLSFTLEDLVQNNNAHTCPKVSEMFLIMFLENHNSGLILTTHVSFSCRFAC